MKPTLSAHQRLFFILAYVVIACICLLDVTYRFNSVRFPFAVLLRPVQALEVQLHSVLMAPQNFVKTVRSSEKLIADLQSKNAQLRTQVAEAEFLKKENETLRQQIEKGDKSAVQPKKVIISRAISIGQMSYFDKGVRDGVTNNSLVMSEGVLIGKVKTVDQFFSSVVLITEGSWQVVVQTQGGVKGVLTGRDHRLWLTQVQADKNIKPLRDQFLHQLWSKCAHQ